jgi:MFS family permease
LGKRRTIAFGYSIMMLAAIGLIILGGTLSGALVCLAFLFFAYEIVVVGNFTLLSQVLPEARATLIGTYFAFNSLGRTISALVAPRLYLIGFNYNLMTMILFVILALVLLTRIKLTTTGA